MTFPSEDKDMTNAKSQAKRALPRMHNAEKQDSFAVGVTSSECGMVTAMAQVKDSNRTHMLGEIIEHYIRTVLAKGGTK